MFNFTVSKTHIYNYIDGVLYMGKLSLKSSNIKKWSLQKFKKSVSIFRSIVKVRLTLNLKLTLRRIDSLLFAVERNLAVVAVGHFL
jgi:hypothetical protein